MKIKKGDNVIVIAGKDKGTTAKVLKAMPKTSMVLVEGANMRKRHKRSNKQGGKGQIVDFATPMHASNVMLVEGGNRTRVGKKLVGEKMVRVSRKSGKTI
jgi:large subunit ribosomal protein L24